MRATKGKGKGSFWRGLVVSLAVFGLLFGGAFAILQGVGARSDEAQLSLVRNAVKRAALTCYAVEGRYPQTADYLAEHYGLRYDEERYMVRYDAFASNVMPDIKVLKRGAL